ncbi:hypothetical protein J3F83DRAFT_445028 [Trichoderma novae-zelandiae]
MYPAKRRRAIKKWFLKIRRDVVGDNTYEYLHVSCCLTFTQLGFSVSSSRLTKDRTGTPTSNLPPPGARGSADATPTRNRCPSYPSPVSKTGHSPCSLSVALLGSLAARWTDPLFPLPRRGFCSIAEPNHSRWAVIRTGQVHASWAGSSSIDEEEKANASRWRLEMHTSWRRKGPPGSRSGLRTSRLGQGHLPECLCQPLTGSHRRQMHHSSPSFEVRRGAFGDPLARNRGPSRTATPPRGPAPTLPCCSEVLLVFFSF